MTSKVCQPIGRELPEPGTGLGASLPRPPSCLSGGVRAGRGTPDSRGLSTSRSGRTRRTYDEAAEVKEHRRFSSPEKGTSGELLPVKDDPAGGPGAGPSASKARPRRPPARLGDGAKGEGTDVDFRVRRRLSKPGRFIVTGTTGLADGTKIGVLPRPSSSPSSTGREVPCVELSSAWAEAPVHGRFKWPPATPKTKIEVHGTSFGTHAGPARRSTIKPGPSAGRASSRQDPRRGNSPVTGCDEPVLEGFRAHVRRLGQGGLACGSLYDIEVAVSRTAREDPKGRHPRAGPNGVAIDTDGPHRRVGGAGRGVQGPQRRRGPRVRPTNTLGRTRTRAAPSTASRSASSSS